MEVPVNNPAGRLYNIIDKIKSTKQTDVYETLAGVFNLDPNDKASILENYAELYKLTKEAKDAIQKLDGVNREKYLAPINDVILALSKIKLSEYNGLANFDDYLSEKIMIRLEYCAEALSSAFGEQVLEEDKLNELSGDVEELIRYINGLDINNELKALFLNNLENIKVAIMKYQLYGANGIKSILESCMGSIILNGNIAGTENEKSSIKKFFDLISRFNQMIIFSKNVQGMLPIATLLLSSSVKN